MKNPSKTELVEKNFQIRIDKDGRWFHQDGEIKRPALIGLFSSVLYAETDGSYWLRTPVEYGRIDVEDAPFLIVQAEIEGDGKKTQITMQDNLGRNYTMSAKYPVFFQPSPMDQKQIQPYVRLDKGVLAKISRPVYYQMAQWAMERGGNAPERSKGKRSQIGLWSADMFFPFETEKR